MCPPLQLCMWRSVSTMTWTWTVKLCLTKDAMRRILLQRMMSPQESQLMVRLSSPNILWLT